MAVSGDFCGRQRGFSWPPLWRNSWPPTPAAPEPESRFRSALWRHFETVSGLTPRRRERRALTLALSRLDNGMYPPI
jgi:hypothetical protein